MKLSIMPLCMCSAMWQWDIHTPGLVASNRMSAFWPARTSTMSLETRLGSATTSRASIRNRSAPCRWKGGGAWGSIALTNLVKIAALVADLAATS